jgi:hypothetical protein
MRFAPQVTLQPAKVDTGSPDRDGFLVFADEALVAVFVRLEDEGHGDERGHWFLEAGFGRCNASPHSPAFRSPDEAQQWVLNRLSAPNR